MSTLAKEEPGRERLAAAPSSMNSRMRKEESWKCYTYTVSANGAIDDHTLARSLTLAYLACTSTTPMFYGVRTPTQTQTLGAVLSLTAKAYKDARPMSTARACL